jgi:hypothetical protein
MKKVVIICLSVFLSGCISKIADKNCITFVETILINELQNQKTTEAKEKLKSIYGVLEQFKPDNKPDNLEAIIEKAKKIF